MITYLYHKRHKQTGLNYFGKTTQDPYIYTGSGTHWTRHLKKYGYDIETIKVWEFQNLEECSKFAVDFSVHNNIVESLQWANLRIENGMDGGHTPGAYTMEARLKKGAKLKGRTFSKETLSKMSLARKGKHAGIGNPMFNKSQSTKQKEIASKTLNHQIMCSHCNNKFNLGNYSRWHGDICKKAP